MAAGIGRFGWLVQPFETRIRLNVRPAPAPKPALRYRLLPELKEMHPGNPIQSYMKCIMEQKKFFFDEEDFHHRQKLLTRPLEELPAPELPDDHALGVPQWQAAAPGGFRGTGREWAAWQ